MTGASPALTSTWGCGTDGIDEEVTGVEAGVGGDEAQEVGGGWRGAGAAAALVSRRESRRDVKGRRRGRGRREGRGEGGGRGEMVGRGYALTWIW